MNGGNQICKISNSEKVKNEVKIKGAEQVELFPLSTYISTERTEEKVKG